MQRKNQIAIRAGQQTGEHFYHSDAGPQSRIYRTEFQSDVTAAHHQKAAGNIFQIESSSRIHQAR